MTQKRVLTLIFFGFIFRLLFGLLLYGNPSDDIQTYLSGLKYYCTGEWPYFGPCVGGSETTYVTQMPGALSGFLIAFTLWICPVAESPFVFFNFLNMVALCFFAWYTQKRFPQLSLFWLLAYILFLPWVLYLTTNVNTASFIIFGSVFFFVGFFEVIQELSLGLIPLKWAFAMMGFSFFWNMQIHLSWVFFIPFLLLAFFLQLIRSPRNFLPAVLFFILGAIPTAGFLVPTLVKFGFFRLTTGKGFGAAFNPINFHLWRVIFQRYISIANYEVVNFLGFFNQGPFEDKLAAGVFYYFYMSLAYILKYLAQLQVFLLILFWFLKDQGRTGWKEIKYLALFFYLLIWVSFWFTVKYPLAHIYHISYPVIMTYSLYCWTRFSKQKSWVNFAKVLLIAGIVYQTYFPLCRTHNYIYQKRADLQAAIDQKNYHLFGERFNGAIY